MGFKKGCPSWNKGLTKETSPKIAEAAKKQSVKMKGMHCSPETEFKKGQISPWKGLTKKTSPIVAKWAKKAIGWRRPKSEEVRKHFSIMFSGKNNPNASWLKLSEEEARKIFDDYKKSDLNINAFAKTLHASSEALSRLFKTFFPDEYADFVEVKHSRKTPMYKRGRAFEYRVRDHYVAKGYFVLRSPRSKGPVDLVALKKGEVLLIQCKMGQNYLPEKQRKVLVTLAESLCAIPLLAYNKDHKLKTLDLRTMN